LEGFRKKFNAQVIELELAQIDPLPINKEQEIVDDEQDAQELIDRLNDLLGSKELTIERRTQIADRISELEGQLESSGKSMRCLTEEQMMEALQEFKTWELERGDLEFQKRIDSGGFGDVFLGYQKSTGRIVAIKKMQSNEFAKYAFEMLCREIQIAAKLNHFAILPFVGVVLSIPFCIVTEFMSGGSLYKRLHKAPIPLTPTKLTIIAYGCAAGLAYIHSQGMLHRDVKSLNILLDADDFPKICDFGLSRPRTTDEQLMTPQVGTAQWTAPEVLDSKPYGEPADVYSYAVLLWELLTKEIPFRGLRDYQVIVSVVQNNYRPRIPPTCPPKLSKFIEVCWDREPDRRPTFEMIMKAFETGEIDFPGTDHAEVQRYINQFTVAQASQFDLGTASAAGVKAVIDEFLNGDAAAAVGKLRSILADEKWLPFVIDSELVSVVARACTSATSLVAFELSRAIGAILGHAELKARFCETGGADAFLGLFSRFGTTSMPSAVENLGALGNVKLDGGHLAKLSAFIVATDLTVRVAATELLCQVVDGGRYDDPAAFSQIARNALHNAIPEMVENLLRATIALLTGLAGLPSLLAQIVANDGLPKIFQASRHANPAIAGSALDLLNRLLSASVPPRLVATFIADFPALFDRWDDPNRERALRSFAILLKSESAFKEIAKSVDVAATIASCFMSNSPRVVLFSLKLLYSFLINSVCFQRYSSLLPALTVPLASKTKSIRFLAASALTVGFEKGGFSDHLATAEVRAFLEQSFTQGKLLVCALRLAGVISLTYAGALFLEPVIPAISPCLAKTDARVHALTLQVLSSLAISNPMSPALLEVARNLTAKTEVSEPLLKFLANIAIQPDGAMCGARAWKLLVAGVTSEIPRERSAAVLALDRVVQVPEALALLNQKQVNEFIKASEPLWSGEEGVDLVLPIVDGLVTAEAGKKAVKASALPTTLRHAISALPPTAPMRVAALRILARTR
jgi:hypothetical protein